MNQKTFRITYVCLAAFMAVLMVLANVQLFFMLSNNSNSVAAISQSSTPYEVAPTPPTLYEGEPPPSVVSRVEGRSTIDHFKNPTLWTGTNVRTDTSGEVSVGSDGNDVEAYRKYDGFLSLQNYLYIEIDVDNPEGIEWITLFLMEDLSYTNYYECNMMPRLSKGSNTLVLSRRDFSIGTGKPDWASVSTIKIGFKAKANNSVDIRMKEISTYSAKPMCTIWFDDGWKSTYTNAFALMEAKGFAGTLSVISSHVGYENFCSQTELQTMYEAGWDMTNHTHTHQNLVEITPQEVETEIITCFDYLMNSGFDRAASHFVPPYCTTNEEVDAVIAKYAATSRPKWDSYNYLPVRDSFTLCFKEVKPDISPQTVRAWIDEAIAYDLWLVLLFHSIEPIDNTTTKYSVEDFDAILSYLAEKKTDIEVLTVSEAVQSSVVESALDDDRISTSSKTKDEWCVVWEDSFEGSDVDDLAWNVIETPPFKNNELQTYVKDNVKVEEGFLKIVSTKVDGEYFSGAVTTNNKQLFQTGKIEIRARLPGGKGIFPAFWMLPQSGASFPEIDIIEFLGNVPKEIWHVMHYEEDGQKKRAYEKVTSDSFNQDFHVFSIEWTDDGVVWRIDGQQTMSTQKYIPTEKMYLYINTAIGGNWPGSPNSDTDFPQTMLIDYVKYYQKNE